MIRTRRTGRRAFVVGLAVAALTAGGVASAAAVPSFRMILHARLAPVSGTTAAGGFEGGLVRFGPPAAARSALPRTGDRWQLTWRLRLPALKGPVRASIRFRPVKGAAAVARSLCTRCAAGSSGTMALPPGQALRIAGAHAVVLVQASTAKLRGVVEVRVRIPAPAKG